MPRRCAAWSSSRPARILAGPTRCTARPTRKIYVVWNSTAGNVTFKTVAGAGIAVNAGAVLILYCDRTNVIQLAGLVATIDDIGDVVITAAASGQMLRFNGLSWVNEDSPYDVGTFIPAEHRASRDAGAL